MDPVWVNAGRRAWSILTQIPSFGLAKCPLAETVCQRKDIRRLSIGLEVAQAH